jgi:hypothetical protein
MFTLTDSLFRKRLASSLSRADPPTSSSAAPSLPRSRAPTTVVTSVNRVFVVSPRRSRFDWLSLRTELFARASEKAPIVSLAGAAAASAGACTGPTGSLAVSTASDIVTHDETRPHCELRGLRAPLCQVRLESLAVLKQNGFSPDSTKH